jgi:hypothetical protein
MSTPELCLVSIYFCSSSLDFRRPNINAKYGCFPETQELDKEEISKKKTRFTLSHLAHRPAEINRDFSPLIQTKPAFRLTNCTLWRYGCGESSENQLNEEEDARQSQLSGEDDISDSNFIAEANFIKNDQSMEIGMQETLHPSNFAENQTLMTTSEFSQNPEQSIPLTNLTKRKNQLRTCKFQ